jgi:hypothetical protein
MATFKTAAVSNFLQAIMLLGQIMEVLGSNLGQLIYYHQVPGYFPIYSR